VSTLHATSGDVRIAYEVRGSGAPVLLVQGLGYPRWGWGPVVDGLAARLQVCSFDNRGIGDTDIPEGPYTVPQLAADAVAVLDAAGFDRTHVVGASLGGMVAQELALSYPERVDRLVLVCTTPGVRGVPMPQPTLLLMAEAPALPPDVALRRFVENALSPDAPVELVDEITRRRLESPPDPVGWAAQAAAATVFDSLDRLGGIEARTLVVHGAADNVVDPANASLLGEAIAGARLELLDGCGHLLMWEQPERFVQLVAGFLESDGG
jgi:pimeloyl-ACP methyl ester carboxylesterase